MAYENFVMVRIGYIVCLITFFSLATIELVLILFLQFDMTNNLLKFDNNEGFPQLTRQDKFVYSILEWN